LLRRLAPLLGALSLVACTTVSAPDSTTGVGRLAARAREDVPACPAGEHRLEIPDGPRAILYVPESVAEPPAPLLVFLHGAGGTAERVLPWIKPHADRAGIAVLIPGSVGSTWDGIRARPLLDVQRLDRALEQTFARCAVDRRRIAVGGFSDGASYALTLGVANGDLFSRILAFSPCGISREVTPRGRPAIFIAHGRQDAVLPIDRCGRPIAGALTRSGYAVRLLEFDGKHEVPDSVALEGFSWFRRSGGGVPH
jgi:phospholipase/carboxylesterase